MTKSEFRKDLISTAMGALIAKAPFTEVYITDGPGLKQMDRDIRAIARGAIAYADAVIAEMSNTPESA